MKANRAEAFRTERMEMLRFCRELDEKEWSAASGAAGWRVQDVVAHLGATCRSYFTPAMVTLMRMKDLERTNDLFVDRRRGQPVARTLAEYERWSRMIGVAARLPLDRVRLPMAELGSFPGGLVIAGAMTFDHHTHLRHDIAPALERPVPGTDVNRMATVLEWMFAVLANQLRSAQPAWFVHPVTIELEGPGGGTWCVGPGGAVTPGRVDRPPATITALAVEFPEWATRRADWRDRDVRISGDADYAAQLLDIVKVV
ncbi:maleylpyruvate isomerase N-terminal domain-containing protein [Streptomyces sp. ISL-98]|uniref:maleylpyruvate isomerase N-terminal domain-containing protein n=1 Tax=Streptomyces sp. ISL-98 TaxID=2819192 RepID=UPI001BEC5C8E|nr:maleylpyruvate isomerase N-terminal domain-containing protein [Streptomyces sp. ISL-98]MBT2509731.1 maleylpyruvate isomerase N-terminal domain-containing protein [Streptomyces sp. ISL-98]